jgi:type VI protein secretion system component Hcp
MQTFLLIPNVLGDTTALDYSGQFQLGSLVWGASGIVTGEVRRSIKTSLSTVSLTKLGIRNSPALMLLTLSQTNLGSVVISIVKEVNGKNLPLHVYTLSNAFLTSFNQSAGPDRFPFEDMTFTFSRMTYQQLYYDTAGTKTGEDSHYWDLTTNKGG